MSNRWFYMPSGKYRRISRYGFISQAETEVPNYNTMEIRLFIQSK